MDFYELLQLNSCLNGGKAIVDINKLIKAQIMGNLYFAMPSLQYNKFYMQRVQLSGMSKDPVF